MTDTNNFAKNYSLLKKCKKRYTFLFFYYLFSSILLLIYSTFNLVCIGVDKNLIIKAGAEPLSPNFLILLAVALVIAPLTFLFGFNICTKQHDLSAFFSIALLTGVFIAFILKRNWTFFDRVPISFWAFVLFSCFGAIASIVGFRTNITYHWLEEQPGYPQFNERLEEQNSKIDKFQCEYNRYVRHSSNEMEELNFDALKNEDDKLWSYLLIKNTATRRYF